MSMARMLGRMESPGCCPGTQQGWRRTRHAHRPDCSGAVTDTRRAKRREQRDTAREISAALQVLKAGISTGL